MTATQTTINQFQGIFSGYQKGYGLLIGYKTNGKKDAIWRPGIPPITKHIRGDEIIGLSPYNNSNGGCRYIGIDIDTEIPPQEFCSYMWKLNHQIFPFMTHNGRWHIYVFFDEFISVDVATKQIEELTKRIRKDKPSWKIDHQVPNNGTGKTSNKFPEGSPGHWLFLPYQHKLNEKRNQKELIAQCYAPRGNPLTLDQFIFRHKWRHHPLIASTVGLVELDHRHKALFNCAMYIEARKVGVTLKEIDENFTDSVSPGEPGELERVTKNAKEKLEDNPNHLENNLKNYIQEASGVELKNDLETIFNFSIGTGDSQGQQKFFENIIFIKKDDCFYDCKTGKEYTRNSINTTYGHLWAKGTPVSHFSSSIEKKEVEEGIYRPDLYTDDSNPIIKQEDGLMYLNIYRPNGYPAIEPTTQQHKDELEWWLTILKKHYPDEKYFNYILDFYSTIYQHPGLKIRHAPIKWSPKFQVGKNMEFDIFRGGLGTNATVIKPGNAVSNEKSFLYDKQIVLVDELLIKGQDYKERLSVVNALKPLITNELQDIRPLYKPHRQIISKCSFMFNTNHKDAITVEQDEERYTILKIEKDRDQMGGPKFFGPIDEAMRKPNPSIYGVVAHFLKTRPIGDFMAQGTCLKTSWLLEMAEATSNPLELEIQQLIAERSEPFQMDVISIQDTWDYLKKEKVVRGRLNDLSSILQKLGGVKLGECRHIYSGRKPTLWIIRNQELYGLMSKSEIAKRCWMPKCYWTDTDDGDPTKVKFSQNPKMVWGMNEYDLLTIKAWYRDEVTAFERARDGHQEDDRPMFEIWRDE